MMAKLYHGKIFYNGIFWDDFSDVDAIEAEEIKNHMENPHESIWDRVNHDALYQYIDKYQVSDPGQITVFVEIIED